MAISIIMLLLTMQGLVRYNTIYVLYMGVIMFSRPLFALSGFAIILFLISLSLYIHYVFKLHAIDTTTGKMMSNDILITK